ncbi:MAG: cytochrome c biogenesis protein CcsA [gamma proteobacterium symbiont of Bathyaustriella thionipta]|nr:cytochrome c biogenesis protein CcsA [gamma proteobacterium symbiont of Bathyaustriella thionipta]MCU7950332.1 cytochrome c biogenesis protein CcsA [gamma proteobacterium symbiont of Bathyaustriella thionipta]MCU7952006.1 cytochrome c biogenesis protein CcsA [gamma proteobacterium symbiont of Bathyaustriella thionipta]MCU7956858.1 cytochrome c biogenesis protein CcsA [gamma proteobacterium symbiont of Bathyaustriella thionipta]MCU7967477.1 cytochrome c biogenesis protein CcsA [gamma proteoba
MFITGLITGTLYLVSTFWLIYNLLNAKVVQDEPNKSILWIGFLAILLHAVILFADTITANGLNPSFVNSFSLMAWLVVLLYLTAQLRKPVETLGVFIFPTASIAVFLQLFWPGEVTLSSQGFELQVHILLSLLAYGLLTIAAGQAILLLIQTRYLKSKKPGGFIRSLPALQSMETLLFQVIKVGFSLLTLALLSGFIFLDNIFAQHLVHKTVLSMVAWLLFAILLWGRWHFGWRGKKAIHFTLGGFIFLMLAYLGSKIVLEIILHKV